MVAGNPVANRGSLEFGGFLPSDPRIPADAEDARMLFEQTPAESLELAAGDFLVSGFEHGTKRTQSADVFVHAVLLPNGTALSH